LSCYRRIRGIEDAEERGGEERGTNDEVEKERMGRREGVGEEGERGWTINQSLW
jgi:hypothetical protein